jgi:hypothetical protein
MIAKLTGLIFLGAGLLLGAVAARADHGDDPIEYHEAVTDLDGIAVDEVYEDSFPTEIVPNHRKNIRFVGSFVNRGTEPASVTLWLDWLDPRLPSGQQTTIPLVFDLLAGAQREIHTGETIIPFTPERLSIHIENNGPGEPVAFAGVLNHVTWPIPEPSAAIICGPAFLAMAIGRRTTGRFQGMRDPAAPLAVALR